jgi:hypothetical protein
MADGGWRMAKGEGRRADGEGRAEGGRRKAEGANALVRHALRQVDARVVVRARRPSRLQPARRAVRSRRDISGIDYEAGLELVGELRRLVPEGVSLAQWAIRWILMFDAVTCAIPGARTASQVGENAAASAVPPLARETMAAVQALYDTRVRPLVHQRW